MKRAQISQRFILVHSGVEPAIQFVLSNWLPRQPMFYGIYERKVSTMALCKLFEHGVTTNDPRLLSVKIRDVVETASSSNRPRTRQQSGNVQQQWIDVPGKRPCKCLICRSFF